MTSFDGKVSLIILNKAINYLGYNLQTADLRNTKDNLKITNSVYIK